MAGSPVGAAEQAIRYLSHYVFKVAISDYRIVSAENGTVVFSYRKPKSGRARRTPLPAEGFMRRFFQHTLPTGFMKVRFTARSDQTLWDYHIISIL